MSPPSPQHALFFVHNLLGAEFVAYAHRVFGFPFISTFITVVRTGYLSSIPRLTDKLIRRNLLLSPATALRHLDRARKNISSTRKKGPVTGTACPLIEASTTVEPMQGAELSAFDGTSHPLSIVLDRSHWMATDLTGRFPVKSRWAVPYLLLTAFHNYIYAEPMKAKSSTAFITAF